MCGITGVFSNNEKGRAYLAFLPRAVQQLHHRGPDYEGLYTKAHLGLGHARLSIIDTSESANQPFADLSERYRIVFNGEIYNFKELRKDLESGGVHFRTASDTEVLLAMYAVHGADCLHLLNGFFSFAIYDSVKDELFLARDRFGIKPLLIYRNEDVVLFASELKALFAYGIRAKLNRASVSLYFQLNYLPDSASICEGIFKLDPGSYCVINSSGYQAHSYYDLPSMPIEEESMSYVQAQERLVTTLRSAVHDRLVADVPLGTFLSGGIDSSVITALASEKVPQLKTFSIGYADEPYFDETHYAELVATKYGTDHHTFKLSNDDLLDGLTRTLDAIDEPFADSSALVVNILSQRTREHVTVALSGDGADELFAGYNKHMAAFRIEQMGFKESMVRLLGPLWDGLPKSRNGALGNRIRQLKRFADAARLDATERYWFLASISSQAYVQELFVDGFFASSGEEQALRKGALLAGVKENSGINGWLQTDVNMVLPGDMLTKVDRMSMANSLEVRVPFLDHRVVAFAMALPDSFKINRNQKKRILQDAFRDYLPADLYNRPKHGFEVPLLKWMRGELHAWIVDDVLALDKIAEQGIFKPKRIRQLIQKLSSKNPGDVHAQLWAVLVFQRWYDRYQENVIRSWA